MHYASKSKNRPNSDLNKKREPTRLETFGFIVIEEWFLTNPHIILGIQACQQDTRELSTTTPLI
jgi:hypothetical protein